jgi:hypothetical protein
MPFAVNISFRRHSRWRNRETPDSSTLLGDSSICTDYCSCIGHCGYREQYHSNVAMGRRQLLAHQFRDSLGERALWIANGV